MKYVIGLTLTALCLALCALTASQAAWPENWPSATADSRGADPGQADSVLVRPNAYVLSSPPWPDSVGVPIQIWADEDLAAYSIGLRITGPGAEYFSFSSLVHEDICSEGLYTPTLIQADGNLLLFGWYDFSGLNPCPTPQGLAATAYLSIDPAAPTNTAISLDSSFVAPSGEFIFVADPAIEYIPQFDNGYNLGEYTVVLGESPPFPQNIMLETTQLEFGLVSVGGSYDVGLTVLNTGELPLSVTSIISDDPAFTIQPDNFTVDPVGEQVVTVTFSPTTPEPYDAVLTVTSDDPETPEVQVQLLGNSLYQTAEIEVSPLSFDETIYAGEFSTYGLSLDNLGAEVLEFSSHFSFNVDTAAVAVGGFDSQNLVDLLESDSLLAANYTFTSIGVTYTIAEVQDYDALIVNDWSDYQSAQATVMNDFAALGKPLFLGTDAFHGAGEPTASMMQSLFSISGVYSDPFEPGNINPGNPIVQGVEELVGWDQASDWFELDGADWVFSGADNKFYGVASEGTPRTVLYGAPLLTIWQSGNKLLVRQALQWLMDRQWLALDPLAGAVPPGGNLELELLVNAVDMAAGLHETELTLSSNDLDEPEVTIPIALNVVGAPQLLVYPGELSLDSTVIGIPTTASVFVFNGGTQLLSITDISTDNPDFTVSAQSLVIPPDQGEDLVITFTPASAGETSASLILVSDDPNNGEHLVPLHGRGILPPEIELAPTSFSEVVTAGELLHRTLTISNLGGYELEWSLFSQPAEAVQVLTESPVFSGQQGSKDKTAVGPTALTDGGIYHAPLIETNTAASTLLGRVPRLSTVRSGLDGNYTEITAQIPDFYEFLDGSAGSHIANGGDDMYMGGNMIGTNIDGPLYYTNGPIEESDFLGDGGQYFTRKYPGLFVLAADLEGVSLMSTTGYLGADDAGSVSGTIFQIDKFGTTFRALVKRVYGAGTPSVNHIFIVEQQVGIGHEFSTDAGSDFDLVYGLAESPRIYYLLFAGPEGLYYGNDTMIDVIETFLNVVGTSPAWLAASPTSGVVPAGDEVAVDLEFNAIDIAEGVFNAEMEVSSSDPDEPLLVVPMSLEVIMLPDIEVDTTPIDFAEILIGNEVTGQIPIGNTGNAELIISELSSSDAAFTLDFDSLTLPPDQDTTLLVTFTPEAEVSYEAELSIISNDPNEGSIIIPLQGSGALPPIIAVTPDSLGDTLAGGAMSNHTLQIENLGSLHLDWEISVEDIIEPAATLKIAPKGQTAPVSAGSAIETHTPVVALESEYPDLESVLSSLNRDYEQITSLIPNRYDFSEGVSGDRIVDGGNDMYDDGNIMSTNYGHYVIYSDDMIVPNALFGSGATFFTRKVPGLFVLAAETNNLSYFQIGGHLGYTSGGVVDETILEAELGGISYKGLVKRVSGQSAPSVNHLIIVPDCPDANHIINSGAGDDFHRATDLNAATRLYYLLYASESGGYIDNDETQEIMEKFIRVINGGGAWLSVSASAGTTQPGEVTVLDVAMDAAYKRAGDYLSLIEISSNDPLQPVLELPATLHIVGVSDIEVPDTEVIFANTFIGAADTAFVAVTNNGNGTLEITSIDIAGAATDFTVPAMPIEIPGWSDGEIALYFQPTDEGLRECTFTLNTNDLDHPEVVLSGSGQGITPPIIALAVDTIWDTLTAGSVDTLAFSIINQGGSWLDFNLEIDSGATPAKSAAFQAAVAGDGATPVALTLQSHEALNGVIDFTTLDSDWDAEDVLPYNVLLVIESRTPSTFTFESMLEVYQAGVPVMLMNDDLGALAAPYEAIFQQTFGTTINGTASASYALLNTEHPIAAGLTESISWGGFSNTFNPSLATWLVKDNSGQLVLATATSTIPRSIVFGDEFGNVWNTGNQQLLVNSLLYLISEFGIAVDPDQGSVPPQGTFEVTLIANARNASDSSYARDLIVTSNDPANPEVRLSVQCTVTGVPKLLLSDDLFEFDSTAVGGTAGETLTITNGGDKQLQISEIVSDNPVFAADTGELTLAPDEVWDLGLSFSPLFGGADSALLQISSNDPERPLAEVLLRGVGLLPAAITVAPDSLSESLVEGDSATHFVTIGNTGLSDLEFTAAFVASPAPAQTPLARPGDDIKSAGLAAATSLQDMQDTISTYSTIYFDDLEGDLSGWYTEDYSGFGDLWHLVEGDSLHPSHTWWCGIDSSGNYENGRTIKTAVISPPIALVAVEPPLQLQFQENYNTEPNRDVCMVDISTDDGFTWIPLRDRPGNSYYSGSSLGWRQASISLTDYLGEVVRIRFHFDTRDEYYNDYPGWFVDDIHLYGISQPWVYVVSDSGTVAPGGTMQLAVTFDASIAAPGAYAAALAIDNNDPQCPQVLVPLTLDIDQYFECGDLDGSGMVSISDAVALIYYIFGVTGPLNGGSGDVDCDGRISMSDIVYLINFIFAGGPPPCDPDNDGVPGC